MADASASAEAEKLKNEANKLFKEKHYAGAVALYTKAIELHAGNAVLFANRAFAHIKLEEYGSAVADASQAIEVDPSYAKGYYRRGDANFMLGKFKDALKDLKTAAKVAPKDPDLRKKLAECEKAVKRIRFEEALATPDSEITHVSDTIDLSTMTVEESYTGPRMQEDGEGGYVISLEFVKAMLEEFKAQRLIHKRFAFEILLKARALLRELPSLVDVEVPPDKHFTVCGDVHGQYYDLLHIWELNGLPSPDNPYLFNGDFVDRGSFSVEVILSLLGWKVLYPGALHLTRGNHESHSMNKIYGFDGEVKAKFSGLMLDVFREVFNWLPLAVCINAKVLVLHGGLFSRDGVTLDDLRKVHRNSEPPDEGLMCECLWSDPAPEAGRQASKRGVGLQFGPDVTKQFLDANGLELLVRSHEVKEEGYEVAHDGRLITVFSAPNYCDQMGNKGAFVRFGGADMVPHFTTFEAVPHPDVKPMAYASSFLSDACLAARSGCSGAGGGEGVTLAALLAHAGGAGRRLLRRYAALALCYAAVVAAAPLARELSSPAPAPAAALLGRGACAAAGAPRGGGGGGGAILGAAAAWLVRGARRAACQQLGWVCRAGAWFEADCAALFTSPG
ncbi:PAPP5 [Scenedesmus sp. PABB004]|nr:PAPP5 [Scenedesmus sp. PABB004]